MILFNSKVKIKGLEEDCSEGIAEAICQERIAVRFNPNLFTPKGIQHMRGYPVLNPSGKLSIIFLVPESDIVVAGTFKTEKINNGARGPASSKAKRKAK